MKAYLISIGDELLIGQTINTNATFLGETLSNNQFEVIKISTIGDSKDVILNEISLSEKSEADVVLITGGLGPTNDDITKDCIVEYFHTKLIQNTDVLKDISSFFQKRGRILTSINIEQSNVPEIAEIIRNKKGTAPGYWIEKGNKLFIVMPGVPNEMKFMFTEFVLPKLITKYSKAGSRILKKTLLTTGIPESVLYEKLGDINEFLKVCKLAFLPNQFGVKIRITTEGISDEEVADKILETEQKIRAKIGKYIYGYNTDTLEETVAKILVDRSIKLAVAESCTGGLISSRLTNVPGSSKFFERGFISYSNASKVEHLAVNEDILNNYGAVSLEVARQMSEGAKGVSGADIGLSVTGIMGPSGETETKPIGLVYIGLCDEKICTAKEFRFGEDRILNKERTSQAALEFLRRHLLGIQYDE